MPRKKSPVSVEIGFPGLRQNAGYVDEEDHPRLKGSRAARTYEEMASNDATIGAALYGIESFLRSIDWDVCPADETPESAAQAQFLSECIHDMDAPFSDLISDILSFLTYGYSLHEIVYKVRRGPSSESPRFRSKYDDGKFGWRAISCRAQRSIEKWDIDNDTGEILGAIQWPAPTFQPCYLPMSRCVLFRTKSYKNNPEGVSVLRRAYRSWNFKKKIEEIEAVGISRDLNGIPIMEIPVEIMAPGASAAQRSVRTQMQTLVSLIARDQFEGLVLPAEIGIDGKPTGYKFRLAASGGQKQIPADPVIRRYDARIMMTLASEFLLLGTEKTGSFALAAEKSSHFARSLEWYAGVICDQLNSVCVRRLMEANGVAPENWPCLKHGPIDTPDLAPLGLYLQQLATSKLLTPTKELEVAFRKVAQLPAPTDAEFEAIDQRLETEAETAAMKSLPPPAPVPPPSPEPAPPAPKPKK